MKIDQLPVEMLMEIFSFLPRHGEVSLVNKLFYGIVCKLNGPNICLRIDQRRFDRFFCDSAYIKSILTSEREISKVEIDCSFPIRDHRVCLSMIEKFSSTIKFLHLRDGTIDESTLEEILSLTPNVHHLDFEHLRLIDTDPSPQIQYRHDYHDLNLKRLRSMSIFSGDGKFESILNRLQIDVLTTLDLRFNVISSDEISAILSKQTKIKSLILSHCGPVDERVLNVIANLSELEVLSVCVTDGNLLALFVKLQKLKKLRNLELLRWDSGGSPDLQTFAETNNASIKHLTLSGNFNMSDQVVGALAKSVPHLSYLRIHVLDADIANTILRHFNFGDVLKLSYLDRHSFSAGDYFNSNLRELVISVSLEDDHLKPWLSKLIAAYPNLRSLKLIIVDRVYPAAQFGKIRFEFKSIVDGLPNLESLALYANNLVIEDWHYLHDRKHNLKFVFLTHFCSGLHLTDDLLKKLSTRFDEVTTECGYLKLIADRNAIDGEQKISQLGDQPQQSAEAPSVFKFLTIVAAILFGVALIFYVFIQQFKWQEFCTFTDPFRIAN